MDGYYDRLLPLFRQFLLIPNSNYKFMTTLTLNFIDRSFPFLIKRVSLGHIIKLPS